MANQFFSSCNCIPLSQGCVLNYYRLFFKQLIFAVSLKIEFINTSVISSLKITSRWLLIPQGVYFMVLKLVFLKFRVTFFILISVWPLCSLSQQIIFGRVKFHLTQIVISKRSCTVLPSLKIRTNHFQKSLIYETKKTEVQNLRCRVAREFLSFEVFLLSVFSCFKQE